MYSIGVDIGYATLKCVVLNNVKEQVFKSNIFHYGNSMGLLKKQLKNIENKLSIKNCYIGVTGEQAKVLNKYQINDISALTEGVIHTDENVQSIMEIGAQSSRYITGFSKNAKEHMEFSMNSSCSAGTGSFLEEQVSRLGIQLEEYSSYIQKATQIPRIAGRCSVFSKTDMIHHQQEGVKIEDILLGLSYALARNYKGNVVQRMKIAKPVMFVGGVANNQGVVRALKEIFSFSDDELMITEDCSNKGALGAALLAIKNNVLCNLQNIFEELESIKVKNEDSCFYEPLQEYGKHDYKDKHICKIVKENMIDGYMGIDIGSTSTNLVLIDKNKEVLSYRYIRTKGNPEKSVNIGLKSIQEEFNGRLNVIGIGTTGSGRTMIGRKIKADLIVNEITAQAKGAIEMDQDVDTIFEIGGQDSKYISIQDGCVVDFEMNKICAAGTGSFIEEQAKKLKIPIEEYEKIALKGNKPLNLGERCTVFIEGNISKALAQGKSKENITAGLSYSIVNNYLNRVVMNKKIGNKIFLQGGIAHNQAVVNAFRAVLGKKISVPPFFSVTGAYGVALLTKEELENKKETRIEASESLDMEDEINKFFLKGYTRDLEDKKLTIGIPRVLFIHKLFPLFNEFFKTLGFNVLLSEETNKDIIALSQEYALDETCYPIKLINGHVAALIKKGVDYIFLPSLYTMKHPISKTREDYACVYMQTAPKIVEKTMELKEKGIQLLSPALSFKFGKGHMMQTLLDLGKKLGKNKGETSLALEKGLKRFKQFEEEVETLGQGLMDSLKEDEKAFVIITRAYGIADEGLNMEIPRRLREMGHKVLTLSNLPAHSYDLSDDYPNMYWPFGQHILSGAKIVKENKNLYAIYLTNHGCGPDTILSHYFKEEMGEKPYLHIEVDEHASNVGVMTRLEAFIESLKNNKMNEEVKKKDKDITKSYRDDEQLYIPYLYPYSHLLQGILRKKGMHVNLLSPTDEKSLEVGKKYTLSKEYLSLTALLGDVFSKIQEINKANACIWVPQTEGSETFGQYGRLLDQKIKLEGYEDVRIESPFMEDLLEDDKYEEEFLLMIIAGDLIMTSPREDREEYLKRILKEIEEGTFNEYSLRMIANSIYEKLSKIKYEKSIYVLGEISIIFNPFLNHNQLEKLEQKNKVYYEPVSEVMYFKWVDFLRKEKKDHSVMKKLLSKMNEIMKQVSKELSVYSPFDKDIDEMIKMADEKLPLYCGGNGRYRMVKPLRCPEHMNGILLMSSMYENTGTILKLLKEQDKNILIQPNIELCFDGSLHSGNDEKIQNFIYYI
ncbi:acyl-CoA dehydratase activase [Crassaminicella profunda]|uniref:acyl-CoA dehydratase activase n=1 Tax=Crassaminicella profunda TaxID=1286698 RepID=UPI001CA685D1|nr:acyl-CoA dehydratase activase [Crassaminicella profunda]QZY53962.1 acyl-CoA dehydratase activase [Crassaminicella profunda]